MTDKKNSNDKIDETKKYKFNKKFTKKKKKVKMDPKKKKSILIGILLVILIGLGILFGVLYGIIRDARLDMSDFVLKYENSVMLDKDGNVIAILSGDENRKFVKISEMSQYLPKAFIAIEDERFEQHMGVDLKRTLGATVKYALSKLGIGSASYGGSTITQQVVKNITEEKDKTWQRKVREMSRAYYIEKQLSKDQILELYLNLIYMGGNTNIFGVEVASEYYFSKSAKDLDLAESAFLAGINNNPNYYDPFIENNEEILGKIKKRTKVVLDKMKELGKINSEEYDSAIAKVDEGLPFAKGKVVENIYSYHTDAAIMQIINQLKEEKGLTDDGAKLYLYGGGFTVYTTQDTNIQNNMNEEALKEKYLHKSKKNPDKTTQVGMVLLDYRTGYVLGVIGGLGEKNTVLGYNRGTQLIKQTGSSMKPLSVVAPGIDKGKITAATVFDDAPYKGFKNYGSFRGLVTVRHAIETSQNIPMLKAIQVIGTKESLEFLKSVGFKHLDDEKDNNISIALGGLTNGASPLEMAAAYGAIANDGVYVEPTFYTKVVDGNGNVVLKPKQESRTVMSKAAAYVVKEILTQPVRVGTAGNCSISGMSVAAKTGTTDDYKDRWLCGFTPYYAAATWYGYDLAETITGWGINPSSLIWSSVMKAAHKDLKGKTFAQDRPDGVVTATVCRDSGLLVKEECKNDPRGNRTYTEYFVKGTVPNKECDCHVKVEICKETGLLANEFCPEKEEKVFITRPNWETDTAWKRTRDAEYMLTIVDHCNKHFEPLDTELPVIKLNGDATLTLNLNDKFNDPGATATDNKDGNLTNKIIKVGEVNTSQLGTYIITYSVVDEAGNKASITRTVIVSQKKEIDNKKPVITLKGDNPMKLKIGNSYNEPGATAKDTEDGDLTSKIVIVGNVDTSNEGDYTIIYKVKDSAGNEASVKRQVIVE